jgi:acyl carrier protein
MKNLAADTRGAGGGTATSPTDGRMDEKIRHYLAETLLIEFTADDSGVREDANLFESGLIDSFEKEFDIKISDDEVLSDSLSSFAKIRSFVEAKVAS